MNIPVRAARQALPLDRVMEPDDPIELLDRLSLMMRGMLLDPAIPDHTKEALRSAIADAERTIENHVG